MMNYLERFNTQTINKRLGYILSALYIFEDLQNEIAKNISESYTPLDPSLGKKGKYISMWRIIDNVNIVEATNSINI